MQFLFCMSMLSRARYAVSRFFLSSHLVHCSLLSLPVVFLSRLVSEFFDSCDFHYFILNLKCLNFLHIKKPTTKPEVLKCENFNKFTSICITITHIPDVIEMLFSNLPGT